MKPDSPGKVALFNEIADFVHDQLHANGEPAHKKRRVDIAQPPSTTNGTKAGTKAPSNAADDPVGLEIKEISVSVPQRKKFELCFTENFLYARAPNTTAPIPAITYAWTDIGMEITVVGYSSVLILSRVHILPPCTREDASSTQLSVIPPRHILAIKNQPPDR